MLPCERKPDIHCQNAEEHHHKYVAQKQQQLSDNAPSYGAALLKP